MGAPGWQQWLRLEVAVSMEPSAKGKLVGMMLLLIPREHFFPPKSWCPHSYLIAFKLFE